MRRAAEPHDEALRTMRARRGRRATARPGPNSPGRISLASFADVARSGVKGLALLFAALVGVGTVFVEANFVSALILLGRALGFAFSLAMKNDKGGILSAALLLFGVMTIWLPPVRGALFLYPLGTISVLILLALIFKFAQAGGTFGLMTGGVLALYVIGVIVADTSRQPTSVAFFRRRPSRDTADCPAEALSRRQPPRASAATPRAAAAHAVSATAESAPIPPEPRTLLASQGAILKFVAGVPYHLKVRTGFATSLRATQGKVALGAAISASASTHLTSRRRRGAGPWLEIDRTLHACNGDAIMTVSAAR